MQLLATYNDLINAKKGKPVKQVDMIILDFSKAFDKVSHNLLVAKLRSLGINGQTLGWIAAFLGNRTQRVLLEGAQSSTTDVLSGVPQGSVIGPLLFLLYINDIGDDLTPGTKCRLFADDCLLYREIGDRESARVLQRNLDALQRWEEKWAMAFNPSKCTVLRIPAGGVVVAHDYKIHDQTLEVVRHQKYLGVTLSHNLKFNNHIDNIVSKARRQLGILRRNLYFCSKQAKEQAYFALVRPQVEYACSLWDPSGVTLINKLEQVQRQGIRFVSGNHRREVGVVTGLIHDHGWLSLQSRRKMARMNMMYKMHNNIVALDFNCFFKYKTSSTRSRHNFTLQKEYCRNNIIKDSFFYRSVDDWNNLCLDTVNAPSIDIFRTELVREMERAEFRSTKCETVPRHRKF